MRLSIGTTSKTARWHGLLAMLGLLLLFASAFPLQAASINNVQTGEVTFSTATQNVTITSVDLTRSILIFSERANSASPQTGAVRGQLTSSTNIQFNKGSATGSVTVRWYVAEFISGVSVQRGSTTLSSTTVNQTISSVSLSESFVIVSKSTTGTSFDNNDFERARLTSATNLELSTNASSGGTADWQVVTFTGSSVQRNILTLASASTSTTATITSVDLSRSFLLYSYSSPTGTVNNIGQKMVQGRFSSATQLEFTRDNTGVDLAIAWEVIQLPVGDQVQSNIASIASATSQSDITISTVDLSRAIAFSGNQSMYGQSWGRTSYSSADNPGRASYTHQLLNTTTLRLNRAVTGTASSVSYFVVNFAQANQAPVLATIGPRNVNEGANLNFGISASDPDATTPTLSAVNVPANATFTDNGNGTGTFNFNPSFSQSGVINVTFIASDGTLADSEVVAITVNNVNQAPVLAGIGPRNVNEGANLNFGVSASDPDATTPALTAVNVPANATFTDNGNGTGTFNFNPSFSQSGVINVTFIASDGTLADSEVVAITVNNVNQAPVLAAIGPRNVNEGANLNFGVSASDADATTPTLSAINIPANATFTDNGNGTGTFNFNPSFSQSGVINVTFIASDGTLADSEVVAITVNNVNQAPVLASIGPRNVNEGANLNFGVTASDPDATTPALTAVNVPTNATFTDNGNGTGTFNFNPSFSQSGVINVTFIASDGTLADSEVVAITVNNANQPPVLAAIGPRNVNEGANLNFGVTASDGDGTTPTLSAVNVPANATFSDNGNGTGTFDFNPDFAQSGVINVTFIASDGTLADSEVVAITVNNVNRTPVLAAIGPRNVNEGVNLNFNVSATDPDATTPSLSAVGVPANATFSDNGNGSGTFSFTPDFAQAGVFNVTFIASDGTLADSEVVAITVNNVNQAPVLATIGPRNVNEGANLSFAVSATDIDATTPALTAVGLPSGATFVDNTNGTGTFNFTPDFSQAGVYNVTFIASDGTLADSEVVAITVNNVNRTPVLTAIGPRNVDENVNLNFGTTASDPDGTTPALSAVGLPSGATFVDNTDGTGTFDFTPSFSQSGVYNVTFIASDGTLADSEVVAITVNNVNLAPVLAAIGPRNVNENANLNFNATANDPDATTPALTVVGLPSGATFNDNANGSGTFNFTPDFTQSGVYNVTFIASDGTLADSEVVAITVNNVNRAPVLATIGPRNVNEGAVLSFDATATDPDGTTPILSAVNLPANAGFSDNGNGSGSLSFSPGFTQSGVYNVTFIASDGTLADSEVVAIAVNDVSLPPVLASIGPRSVTEGQNLNFGVSASDPDLTIPSLTAVNVPANASFTDNGNGTGTFDFSPTFVQAGVFNVTFIASDGTLADSEVVAITVNEAGNQRPVLASIGPRSVTEGQVLNFSTSASDPDGTTPSFAAAGVPANATFTDNGDGTASFNFHPSFVQAGIFNVTFIASDGTLADSEVVAVTVNEAGNQRPVLAAIGPRNVTEGQNLNFTASATDVDGTTPTLSAVNVPLNATFVNNGDGTGTLDFNPSFVQAGIFNVTFIASDGALADSEVVAITVNEAGNQRPVLATIGPRNVTEGQNLNFAASASDVDGTTPTLSAVNLPVNATFSDNGNGTGTFDFDPSFVQAGVFNVTFIASDGTLADSEVVAVTVIEAGNQRPVLAAIGPRNVNEGAALNFAINATDPDATFPAFSAANLPANASLTDNGDGTASFAFLPDFTQAGVFNVTFIASDGSLADSEVVAITVNNVNLAPVLAAIGAQNIAEGSNLSFVVSASDPDGTTPSVSAVSVPTNASFIDNGNGTGTFNFDPDFAQSGVYNVTFIASDGTLADSEIVAITVTNTNRTPVLAAIGPRNVNEGANLNFIVNATDPDGGNPTLTAVGTPPNATFVDNGNGSGTFDFAPDFNQSGVFNVTFIASDGTLADSEVVAITVNNVNVAPVLATIGPRSVAENAVLNFNISASDFDGTTPSFTAENVPTNATFLDHGDGTASFSFAPDFSQEGVYNVRFIASDGTLADSELVAITVTNTNRAPVLAAIGPRNVNEGAVLNFVASATDPDATTPTLSAVNLPVNASFSDNGNGTGSFSFSPSFDQAGNFNVTIITSDGTLADSEVVAITVNDVNRAPVLATIGPRNVNETANLNFIATATDPDLTTPTLVAENLPANATFVDNGNGSGSFNFNPTPLQAGVYNVRFIASDGALSDTELVAITVNDVSQPPVLATIGPRSVTEGQNLNFNVSATDIDATTPTLTAVNTPLNATFVDNGNGTGTFNFNPNFVQAGVYNVTFIASDGALADTEVVAITVDEAGNQRPVLAAIGARNVTEGQNLNFDASATDVDGTTPTLSAVNLPLNATFVNNGDGTGTFDFDPSFVQAGVYNVTFVASDGSLADSEVVAITVNEAGNQRPVLAAIGPRSVTEGQNLNFDATATDADETIPTLTVSGLPTNATFVDNLDGSGTFDFNPDFVQAGVYNVTFIASDGTLADSEVVAITVNDAGNQRPVLAAIGARSVTEGQNLNFGVSATDVDGTTPTMSAVNLPLNATFVDNGNGTGTFNFNPNFVQAGVYNVTFIASDGALADSEVVPITVNEAGNQRPVLAAIGARNVTEGQNLNFDASATDVDGTTPTLSAVNLPLNATFVNNGDGTGTFDFDPSFVQAGVYNVTFIASDGALADSEIVAITVNEAGNQRPVLAAIGPRNVTEDQNLNFGVSASDPDATTPALTAVSLPLNATFSDNGNGTGTFDFNPTFVQAGVYNVTFIASDGTLADSEVVAVTVIDAGNQRPVLATIGPRSVTEGQNLNFNVTASDLDATIPTLTAVNAPLNATFVDNGNGSGTFNFNPNFVQAGVYNVTFIASDGALADSEVVAITVNEAGNQRPVLATIGPRNVTEGQTLNFNVSAVDPDQTTPTFTAVGVPVNATFVDNGNGTGTFNFQPNYIQSAIYVVTFITSDGTLADSESVTITVNEAGNQRPVLAAIGPKTIGEGLLLTFGLSATDADQTFPVFTAFGLPANASVTDHGNGTATFNFTPSYNQAAIYNVIFVAFDGSLADSETVQITVTNTNRAPILAAIGPKTIAEGGTLNFGTSASDPDGAIPTMTAVNVPVNASYVNNGNGTGTFTFNPNFSQAGVYNVTFIASDGNLADSEVVAITVTGTNLAPVLASIGPRSVTEGQNLNFNATATDPDGTNPAMTALNVPTNATFVDNGNGSGTFNFNPSFIQAGLYNVTFIASDGLLADTEVVAITVNEAGNQRPVLATIGPRSVTEGASLNFNASATDPDATTPTLSAANLPANATFVNNGNGTGSFSFSPDFLQAGVYNVTFIASDGTLADSEVVAITVLDAGNQRPVLAAIGSQLVDEGQNLSFGVSATDPDATTPVLTVVNVPLNATFTDNGDGSGSFNFNPAFDQAGVYNVTFIASDGGLSDSEVVQITVNDAGNQRPVLAAIGARSVTENQNLNFGVSATDPDATTPTLLAVNVPLNAIFTDNGNGTGTFDFDPSYVQAGIYNVTFIASDGALADSEVVQITVNEAGNQRPVLAAIGPRSVTEGAILNFAVSASDVDATTPTLSAVNTPLNATFTDNGNGTGSFSFSPSFVQAGIYNVTFIASDGALADSEVVAITVNEAGNQRPVLATIGSQLIDEGLTLNFNAIATDPDATTPTISAVNLPLNASFVDNGDGSGSFSFTPDFVQSGVYNVTFIASDGALADSEVVQITVNDAGNQRPVLATIGSRSVTEGQNLNFNISATDADATTPTLSAVNVPLNANFADNGDGTGTFDFDPSYVQAGIYNVTFIASDGALADSEVVQITVNEAGNQRPVLAAIGPRSVTEGAVLNFNISASDVDATIPTLSAVNAPLNATFTNNGDGTGTFSFSPSFVQAGVYNVTFIASDGTLADSEVVAITVNEAGNQRPVLATIGPRSVNEGATLNFNATATDPDATIPTLSAVNLPTNASFVNNGDGSGTFTFNPDFVQAGVYNVTIIASDGTLADSEVVAITVFDAGNQRPVLATIGPRSVTESQNLNFSISATDPDLTTPTLSAVNVPPNATFVNNGNGTGTFDFNPGYTQAGVYNVTFIASDGALADSEVVAITVIEVGNQRPVLTAIGPKNVNEGAILNFGVSASDLDATFPALTAVNVPVNATFTDNGDGTGTFNFTPDFTQSGVINVTFIASDGALADSEVVAITVNNVNLAPVLAAIGPKVVAEGANLNFAVTATDPDLTIPTLAALNVPLNATFVDNGNGSGTFDFDPDFTQEGVYNVTFIASDGALADTEVVVITVGSTNLPPVLAAIGPRSVNEGANLNFGVSATDPDLSTPALTAVNVPLNATFIDNGNGTGTFNFNPSFTQSGVFNVTFIASDGALADSEVVAITVNNVNLPPVLAAIGPRSVNEGQNLNFVASASDPDATTPSLVAENVPTNATFADNGDGTGTFDFNPTYTQSGVYNVRFIASDGVLADTEVVAITVVDQGGNVPPQRVTDLMATIVSDAIQLSWTPITTDSVGTPTLVDRYVIYRGTRAYFTPTPAESIGVVAPAIGSFTDNNLGGANVVGDTAVNYFYAVVVVDQIERRSNVSNRAGEYDYQIITTATTDFNLAGLPFANTGLATAQDVINSMGGTTNINTLNNYIPSSQSYQARFAAGFGTNFAVTPGSVFQVNAKTNFVWSIAGRVPDPGTTSYSIMTTPTTDYSLIMIPFEFDGVFLVAQDVINSIPGLLNTLNEFLPASQSYRSRFAAGFGTNFSVKAGRVYQANAAATGVFPAP